MELLVLVGILLLLYLVESIYYRIHALEKLSLKVRFSKDVVNYGEDIEIVEVAENKKRLPLPYILLKFIVPKEIKFYDMDNTSTSDNFYRQDMLTMRGFSKHTRRIKAQCTKRGYYAFPRVGISTSDLFLTRRISKEYENNSHIVVLPEILKTGLVKTLTSVTMSELQCRRTLLTDPFSLAGIREYAPGDPMKSINWKASARTGDLMVNQNASTCSQKVHVFINLEYYNQKRSTSLLEKAISFAYTYLDELSSLGVPTSVYTNGLDAETGLPVVSESVSDSASIAAHAISLGRIDLGKPAVPFAEVIEKYISSSDRDDFILVISPQFNDKLAPVLKDIKERRPSMNLIMPCYKLTPEPDIDPALLSAYTRWEVLGHD